MSTALRIVSEYYSGGSSAWATAKDFDEDEYRDCIISFAKLNYVQESQKQAPRIYDAEKAHTYAGTERYRLSIELLYDASTETKIKSLYNDYGLRYRVYYKYIESPATYKSCILDPNYDIVYTYGEFLYRTIILNFYETYETF